LQEAGMFRGVRRLTLDPHAKIPGSEFALIPKAGHLENLEQPEAFESAVMAFLQKHKGLGSLR
jgi:pimeloyl-ACP methyl ester carboxylesterase